MPDATGTLDLIDGAIRDWDTSRDAMRWTPESDSKRVKEVSAAWIDEPNCDDLYAQLRQMHDTLVRGLAETFGSISAGLQAMAAAIQSVIAAEVAHSEDAGERPRWHKRRCPYCNPSCAITPPCPGGREYQRRLRARARRRRR